MVLDRAQTARLVTQNVARLVKDTRNHGAPGDLERWDPAEVARFREVADLDPWGACFRLSLCGLRRSEVMALSWSRVDLDQGTVEIAASRVMVGRGTKTGKPKSTASARTIPVDDVWPGTVAALRALKLASAPSTSGLVLVDAVGDPVRPDHYSRRFRELCTSAGVRSIRLHALRHTCAYALHQVGVSPADAAAFLGHGVAVHLSTYVFARRDAVSSAATALGAAYAAGGAS
jgi:integrase